MSSRSKEAAFCVERSEAASEAKRRAKRVAVRIALVGRRQQLGLASARI